MRLKVNEAIAQSEANGKKVLKQEIAKKLFSGANENTQRVNMSNLCRGKTQRIKPEWINIIVMNAIVRQTSFSDLNK